MAICRLKRVAADNREDDIKGRLPKIPKLKNGKKVALIGAGCASLTVANDLMPLGYSVTIFEQYAVPGGLMRTNIPSFRLPAEVLNDEIAHIVDMGVDLKLNHPVKSMRELLDKGGFDAVFVGAGAPKGKELSLPGRKEGGANIHIGITWLESVAFEHIKAIGKKVLIIGVGNTAMDCCRTSLRLGATEVKVMARKPRQFFKASAWELEDAEEEHVKIVINRSPKAFVIEGGKLKGMNFDVIEYDIDAKGRITAERITGEEFLEADDVILAIGQENAFPVDRARSRHRVRQVGCAQSGCEDASSLRVPACFSAATRPSVPRTSSGPWSMATRRRSRSTTTVTAKTRPSAWRRA